MTWAEANRLRVCLWCGAHDAGLYRAVRRIDGRTLDIRACGRCIHHWEAWTLNDREPMYEEVRS